MYIYNTRNIGRINIYIPSTLVNAVCRFKTYTNQFTTYNITYDSNMEINKPFNFEPGKTYIISVNYTTILWNELVTQI